MWTAHSASASAASFLKQARRLFPLWACSPISEMRHTCCALSVPTSRAESVVSVHVLLPLPRPSCAYALPPPIIERLRVYTRTAMNNI